MIYINISNNLAAVLVGAFMVMYLYYVSYASGIIIPAIFNYYFETQRKVPWYIRLLVLAAVCITAPLWMAFFVLFVILAPDIPNGFSLVFFGILCGILVIRLQVVKAPQVGQTVNAIVERICNQAISRYRERNEISLK